MHECYIKKLVLSGLSHYKMILCRVVRNQVFGICHLCSFIIFLKKSHVLTFQA